MYLVIMCGGSGKRFWPKSREAYPKQFLKIVGEKSLLQETFERAKKLTDHDKIFIVTNSRFKELVLKDLPGIKKENILCEPLAKNTAPCIALSLFYIKKFYPEDQILFMPADHLIKDISKFKKTVNAACERLKKNSGLVIFGIKPRYAETGYGYIKKGDLVEKLDSETVYKTIVFTEKPDGKRALEFVKSGQYLWNSGMFLYTMPKLAMSFKKYLPDLYEKFSKFLVEFGENRELDPEKIKKIYSSVESISIDYGLIEKEDDVEVIECSFDWSDVGSWKALEEIWPLDKSKNAIRGKSFTKDSKGIVGDIGNKMLVALGVEDLVLIETDDVIFICKKDSAGKMKEMLEEMKANGLKEFL